ncbi:hypothetical protein BG015_011167 [Linnemannia schmuckeri]|uniref:Uncharacterized protein n=1 Tax=Linnemannia schmuckeri TaxID=64567 RepID=A0A9P5RTI3_9FUNG|nr:hypothetical protein BG015_011167 [Linnemannia schmuckeri]
MKSFTAILFSAVAILVLASAVPVPQEAEPTTTSDTRNQKCKIPIQKTFDTCVPNGGDPSACQAAFNKGNEDCNKDYPTSLS